MRVPSLDVAVFIAVLPVWSVLLCGYFSAGGWPVGQVDVARGKGLGIHELQRRLRLAFLEEAFAATHDHGVNHEFELVDQAVLEQRADEGTAAGDHDILAGESLELGDLLRDVLPDQGRVVPLEGLFEGGRDHVLADAVHPRGYGVLLRVLLRPERSPLLVEDTAHEQGVRRLEPFPDSLPHLVVEVGEVPLLGRLHHAVQRQELRRHNFPHLEPPRSWCLRPFLSARADSSISLPTPPRAPGLGGTPARSPRCSCALPETATPSLLPSFAPFTKWSFQASATRGLMP